MTKQQKIVWEELICIFQKLLGYALFHQRSACDTDLKIYELMIRIDDIRNLPHKEVSEVFFNSVLDGFHEANSLLDSELYTLKYYSKETDERLQFLVGQLRNNKCLTQEEIDSAIDNLSLHLLKLKILNQ